MALFLEENCFRKWLSKERILKSSNGKWEATDLAMAIMLWEEAQKKTKFGFIFYFYFLLFELQIMRWANKGRIWCSCKLHLREVHMGGVGNFFSLFSFLFHHFQIGHWIPIIPFSYKIKESVKQGRLWIPYFW